MRPIEFTCEAEFSIPPEELAEGILDLARWPEFDGYGPLPGIRSAEFLVHTPDIIGTRIRVTNRDGSTHVEEIREWDPHRHVSLHMDTFVLPLSRLATHFEEAWHFERRDKTTYVKRVFKLYPTNHLSQIALWLISRLFRRAVSRHFQKMASQGGAEALSEKG